MKDVSGMLIGVVLLAVAGACNRSSNPTTPTTSPQSAYTVSGVTPVYTLSGMVSESTAAGVVPVPGVRLEILSCDAATGNCSTSVVQSATTDANGAYRLPALFAGKDNFLWVSNSDGHFLADDPPEPTPCDGCFRIVTLTGDTRLDILLHTQPR